MSKTITVRGTGNVSVSPDLIIISMTLSCIDENYGKAMENASVQLEDMRCRFESAGFSSDELKTVGFRVRAEYQSVSDNNGRYKSVFKGYNCVHQLKLEFDMDTERLSKALSAAAGESVSPELSVSFTVKDPEAVNAELLKSAAVSARRKAEILCDALGVRLGELVKIEYNWNELNVVSPTRYETDASCLRVAAAADVNTISFQPDDIKVSDSAAFIWEIE